MSCFIHLFQENLRENYEAGLKAKLEPFSHFLGTKKFFVSDEITYADFHLYELLDILRVSSVG
jgi:hypothetical protein